MFAIFRTLPAGTALGVLLSAGLVLGAASPASAAVVPGDPAYLGTAAAFSVLAGSAVSNTGPSVLNANLGVHPSAAISGFPPGLVGGAVHAADAPALQAHSDVTQAANAAMAVPSYDVGVGDLVGKTFLAGAYSSASELAFTGTITLKGDADDVFIFTSVSTLVTGSASRVALIGVQPCNVYWRIGSSATLGTGSTFVGTIMASTSITATAGTTIQGRLFAQTAAVTLDNNVFTGPACVTAGGDGSPGGEGGADTGGPGDTGTTPPAPTATTPEDEATGNPGGPGSPGGSGGAVPAAGVPTLAATGTVWPLVPWFLAGGVLVGGVLARLRSTWSTTTAARGGSR